jgi:NADH dehydrogenase (ubiquinone) flavoprotein 2
MPQIRSFSAFAGHRDTSDNLEESPFEFTAESYGKIKEEVAKYPDNYKCSAVLGVLTIAQKQNNNFLTLSAMNKTAKILEMTPMQVYEVASFFTMFNRTQPGKYHLQVCGTTPCLVRGADKIMKACKDFANINDGETSADGLFTLQEVECLGACANAPMVQVNNEWFYEDLTYESMQALMKEWKEGREPKTGPQNGRLNALGIEGRTSLFDIPLGDQACTDRDFAGEK